VAVISKHYLEMASRHASGEFRAPWGEEGQP
jgi:hypothetical protein